MRIARTVIAVTMFLSAFTPARAEEFRGYWVDFGNPGMRSASEISALVADTKAARMNAILAQVRPRGDAFYVSGYEPRSEYLNASSTADPLRDLINLAHAQNPRIEVHAWFNAYKMWSKSTPPVSAYHPYRLFPEFWNRDTSGLYETAEGWFFDPGHNRLQDYNARVVEDLARRYPDLDGIHFDFVRYPTYNWGFSDTALARFSAQSGVAPAKTDGIWTTPKSNTLSGIDPAFSQWRRDQVTGFVREAYARAYRVNPNIKMSGALITIGGAPGLSDSSWYSVDPPKYRYQDWYQWMKEGIVDEAILMNYEAYGGGTFNGWSTFAAGADDGRNTHGVVGQGNYLNTVPNSILQLKAARSAGAKGHATYSYAAPSTARERARWAAALTVNNADNANAAPYPTNAPPLSAPWKHANGLLMGRVTDALTGAPPIPATNTAGPVSTPTLAGAAVRIAAGPSGQAGRTVPMNANGVYAFVNAPPGNYTVEAVIPAGWPFSAGTALATVQAGRAAEADLVLTPAAASAVTIVDNGEGSTTSNTGSFYTETGASLLRVPASDAYNGVARAIAAGSTSVAAWTPFVPVAGSYRVYAWWTAGTNRATAATYRVGTHVSSVDLATVNQRENGGRWNDLGTAYFHQGRATRVTLAAGTGGYAMADAIRLVRETPEFWPCAAYTVLRSLLTDPASDGEYAYFGQRDGTLFAYHLGEERPAWSFRPADLPSGARHSRLSVHEGTLYAGGVDGRVRAFRTFGGFPEQVQHVWSSGAISGGVWGAPSVLGDDVYVGGGDACVYILDAATGAVRAKSVPLGASIRSTPAVVPDSGVWVQLQNGAVARLSLDLSAVLWMSPAGTGVNGSAYVEGNGVFATATGALMAMSSANGRMLWAPPAGMASPVDAPMGNGAGTLYVVTTDSRLWALDTATGQPRPGYEGGLPLAPDTYGAPLVVRNESGTTRVYIPGSASLTEVSPAGIRRHDLANAMGTHGAGPVHLPAAAGGLILATSDNGQLLAWDAPTN